MGERLELPVYFRLDKELKDFNKNREEHVSQSELSRLSGVSITTVNAMVNNKTRQVSLATLDALCRVLKCEPGDLLARR